MNQPAVFWEITRDCSLECRHCLTPEDHRVSDELSTYEAYKTVDQIVAIKPLAVTITGGDPLARGDLFQIIDYATRRGLKPAVALTATANLTTAAIENLRTAGAARLVFSLNGSTAQRHDSVSGKPGSFEQTISAIQTAVKEMIPVEIDTLITRRNVSSLASLGNMLTGLGIEAWNVHFLVPIGKARNLDVLSANEAERVFELLATIQRNNRFRVRTIEAPEYRRYLLQLREAANFLDFTGDFPQEIVDAAIDDVVFIAANGAVRPSGFLPIAGGNVRFRPLFGIVNASDLFIAVRDRKNLTGKCARCEYKEACGGSRARAWAMTGLLFGPDPLCIYQPKSRTS